MSDPFWNWVGPVLLTGEVADAVVRAIRSENNQVELMDRGAYVRVLVKDRCAVTRQAIEAAVGRPFALPKDLEAIMPSFKGFFAVDEDRACWEFSS
jgi:hypothetical protein